MTSAINDVRGCELPAFVDGLGDDNYPGSNEENGGDCLLIVLAIVDLFECVDERVGLVLDIQLWCCDSHWRYANWVNRLINSLWHRCVGALKKPPPGEGQGLMGQESCLEMVSKAKIFLVMSLLPFSLVAMWLCSYVLPVLGFVSVVNETLTGLV